MYSSHLPSYPQSFLLQFCVCVFCLSASHSLFQVSTVVGISKFSSWVTPCVVVYLQLYTIVCMNYPNLKQLLLYFYFLFYSILLVSSHKLFLITSHLLCAEHESCVFFCSQLLRLKAVVSTAETYIP